MRRRMLQRLLVAHHEGDVLSSVDLTAVCMIGHVPLIIEQ